MEKYCPHFQSFKLEQMVLPVLTVIMRLAGLTKTGNFSVNQDKNLSDFWRDKRAQPYALENAVTLDLKNIGCHMTVRT